VLQQSDQADAQYALTGTVRLKMPALLPTLAEARRTRYALSAGGRMIDAIQAVQIDAPPQSSIPLTGRRAGAEEATPAGSLGHQLSASARACRMTR
jgi:hypothetical protein